jgi:hypothetical protein
MTTSSALRAGTHTETEPLGGARATGLPLLGIMAAVMSQIPGIDLPEEPADRHQDVAFPPLQPQPHAAVTGRQRVMRSHTTPRARSESARGASPGSGAGTMKTNTGARAGARSDGDG